MTGMLAGKVALITGGGGDIGRAAALIFAREGAKVVVSDIDRRSGEETAAQVEVNGGEARFVAADVTKEDEVRALVEQACEAWGGLDCAFNNAGIEGAITPTTDMTVEDFTRTITVNLTSVWLCMKHQIPVMLQRGGGAIVNASSAAGLVGFPMFADYVASKHGVIGLTRTAALEYAKQGIRVNAVCPGMIDTAMVDREAEKIPDIKQLGLAIEPVGRLGRPEEVGEAAAWLCSDAASFVTGHPMAVCGGGLAQ